MSKRGVGFLLVLTATIALGALAQDYRFDQLIATEQAAGRSFEGRVRDLADSLASLHSAQQAYVAAGQTSGDWPSRATALMGEVESGLEGHRAAAVDTEVLTAFGAAADDLARLKKIDAQARASVDQGDRLHALDLVLMDGAAAVQKIGESLAAARTRNRQVIDGNVSKLARLRLAMNGVAMLFVLAVAIYFGRALTILGVRGAPSMAQMLRDLPPPVKAGTAPAAAQAVTPVIAPAHAGSPLTSRPSSLSAAAELCVDLAKVLDSADVPALLERTATVLDARGIVLWAIDSDGARLRPSLSHGYPEKVLAKLRPLQIDADNVTSLAFRSLQPQVMNGASAADAAAIAVPLLTATGCVGVMAAELRHNRPHVDLLPVAQILGAQFSTLIAPPDGSDRGAAQS